MRFFYRDGLECVEHLFGHPLIKEYLLINPHQVYKVAEAFIRVFGEWMSGDTAWSMQVISLYMMLLHSLISALVSLT